MILFHLVFLGQSPYREKLKTEMRASENFLIISIDIMSANVSLSMSRGFIPGLQSRVQHFPRVTRTETLRSVSLNIHSKMELRLFLLGGSIIS